MATAQTQLAPQARRYELIDAATLAKRWHITERFVKEATRVARNRDPIPALRIHRRTFV